SGNVPQRRGNAHPNIVPYQVFAASDGHLLVAVGNDGQFARFCDYLGRRDLASDPRYATNPARLANRDTLIATLEPLLATRPMADIVAGLEARKVPVGPVQTVDQVFASDQVAARGMVAKVARDDTEAGHVRLIGNPLKLSASPVTYRRP